MMETINMQDYNAELPEGTPMKFMGIDSLFKTVLCNPGLRNVGRITGSLNNTFNAFGYCDSSDGSGFWGVFVSIKIDIDENTYYGFQFKIKPYGGDTSILKFRTLDCGEANELSNWHTIVIE